MIAKWQNLLGNSIEIINVVVGQHLNRVKGKG